MHTKLFVPAQRADLVQRPRLVDKLNNGLASKLILVSAPAGFGKTTLISAWLGALAGTCEVSWLSLDEGDGEPDRFFAYFIRALQAIHPFIGSEWVDVSPLPPPESLIGSIINQIAGLKKDWVFVLDDYHLVSSPEVHLAMETLIEHMPAFMHIVLISRSDPPFSLARWRVRHQLIEIRARDLRFSRVEVDDFMNRAMALNLSADEVDLLEKRTEGWVAGLQLASYSLSLVEDRKEVLLAFAGDDRYIADYLMEEVLSKQTQEIKNFLIETSVLSRLTGSLCDELLERQSSQKILDFLEQTNLFLVPLDNRRQWYRYHHLFRDLLGERLSLNPEKVRRLNRRAGQWFAQNDILPEAIEHFLSAEDYEEAIRLILKASGDLFMAGQIPRIIRWWERIPSNKAASNSKFSMMIAWALLAVGRPREGEKCLLAIERSLKTPMYALLEDVSVLSPDVRNALIEVAVVRISSQSVLRVDEMETLELSQKILPYLVPENQIHLFNPVFSLRPVVMFNMGLAYKALGRLDEALDALDEAVRQGSELFNIHIVAPALSHQAEAAMILGRLNDAAQICRHGLSLLDRLGGIKSPLSGQLHVKLGQLHYEWNDLNKAIEHFEAGIALARTWKNLEALLPAYAGLAQAYRALGEAGAAQAVLQRYADSFAGGEEQSEILSGAYDALLRYEFGETAAALSWVESAGETTEISLSETEKIILIRLILSLGRPAEAIPRISRMLESAEEGARRGRELELLLLDSRALAALGDFTGAKQAIFKALVLAQHERYLRIFLDGGEAVAGLLREAAHSEDLPGYGKVVLAAFPSGSPVTDTPAFGRSVALQVEPLSDRELEVLRLIADGLSNKEIASRLYLSAGTIKVHAHNIYSKLGVSGRTQAVKKARAVGYL